MTARAFRESALAEQDATLATVGAGAPVYRWTTALNGYAVRMTAAQARDLAATLRWPRSSRTPYVAWPPPHPVAPRPRPTTHVSAGPAW